MSRLSDFKEKCLAEFKSENEKTRDINNYIVSIETEQRLYGKIYHPKNMWKYLLFRFFGYRPQCPVCNSTLKKAIPIPKVHLFTCDYCNYAYVDRETEPNGGE